MKNFKLVLAYAIKWVSILPFFGGLFFAGFQIGDSFDYESFVWGQGLIILGIGMFISGNLWAKSINGIYISKPKILLIITLFFISGLTFTASWQHQKVLQQNYHSSTLIDLRWNSKWDWIYDLWKFN